MNTFTFLTALILLVQVEGQLAPRRPCPNGYLTLESADVTNCYKFHHANVTWPEAFSYCKTFGSHVVMVNTWTKHQFLKIHAKAIKDSFVLPGFWMAASDAISEGRWVWLEDGTNMTYAPWAPGNPHNVVGRDCAAMWRDDDFNFADFYCSKILHPICEIDNPVNYPFSKEL